MLPKNKHEKRTEKTNLHDQTSSTDCRATPTPTHHHNNRFCEKEYIFFLKKKEFSHIINKNLSRCKTTTPEVIIINGKLTKFK